MRVIGWLKDELYTTVCTSCADFSTDMPETDPANLDSTCSICGKMIK